MKTESLEAGLACECRTGIEDESKTRPAASALLRLFFLCAGCASLRPLPAHAGTVALWLFDEQEELYPSSILNDAGPESYYLILGRGGKIVPGKFGHALRPVAPAPLQPVVTGETDAGLIRFGLKAPPKKPGRTAEPMTWFNATFAATFTSGDLHLRGTPFANASDSKLNLGGGDWTVEFWLKLDAGATGEGTIFELGAGPRGENDVVTRLVVRGDDGVFAWQNQPAGAPVTLRTDVGALRAEAWAHCAFVHDGTKGELRHYVNGRLASRQPTPRWAALPHGDEAYVSVGRDGGWGRALAGAIDELRISDEARYAADFAVPGSFSRLNNGHYQPPALHAGPPLLFPGNRPPAGVIDLGSRKHLFLDGVLLDQSEHITFQGHAARVAERVVERGGGWIAVVEGDDGLIRLYTTGPKSCLLVYTSRDGVHFDEPDLGHGVFEGRKNVVTRDPATVGCVILDPNAPADERWKIVSGLRQRGGLFVYTSGDGFNFKRNETAALPFWVGSATTLFYDDQRQVYVIHNRTDYYRGVEDGNDRRQVLTEVKDLMAPWPFTAVTPERIREVSAHHRVAADQMNPWWLDNGPLAPGGFSLEYPIAFEADPALDPVGTDVYNTHAQKYAWAPDAYVAFPLFFFHYHNAGPATRRALAAPDHERGTGLVETQLAVSRDGLHWERYPRPAYVGVGDANGYPILRPYTGQGMVRRGKEIWQYCFSQATYHDPWSKDTPPETIHRLVQRVDGFVSLDAAYTGGTFTTKPLRFSGNRLVLNVDTDATGYAQFGFVDEKGVPIPGFSVDDCVYVSGDSIDYEIEWLGKGKDLSALAGRTVQLVARMRGTSLYALQFVTR